MTFGERVFIYCERGTNEALLAEPFNAFTNGAFLIAALIGFVLIRRLPAEQRSADQYLFAALVFIIGLGSLSFHLYADQGTSLADIIPIGVFMLVYLGFALNRFLNVPPGWTVFLAIVFAAVVAVALQAKCWDGRIGFPGAEVEGAAPCLNGSLPYLPALAAMIVIGFLLAERGNPAGRWILWAGATFAVSVTFRSLDMVLCGWTAIDGHKIGTHFIWHILNALTLLLLIKASLFAVPKKAAKERATKPLLSRLGDR